jgi:hypothetical protein
MAQANQRVRVLRAFRHKGETVGIDSVIDLDKATAIELRTANKVVFEQADVKLEKTDTIKPAKAPAKSTKSGK